MDKCDRGLGAAAILPMLGLLWSSSADAINWVTVFGTEPAEMNKPVQFFGFLQADYYKDTSDPNASGEYVPPKLIGPDLTSQSAFNIARLRLGARGRPIPEDANINYLLRVELGNNGITQPVDAAAKLTDASVTLNHIPGARLRLGMFKTPGQEDGFQAGGGLDYVEYAWVTNMLVMERPPNGQFTANVPPTDPAKTGVSFNAFTRPVAAFRDVGVQVFDSFLRGDWELTYAAMVGNGNGLGYSDNDDHKDVYGYLAVERIFGGKGVKRESVKYFGWLQSGKRTFDGDNDGLNNEYDRDRGGVGISYRRKPWRATAEWVSAKGMIFIGPDKPSFDFNGPASPGGSGLDAKASGWYAEAGWYIPGTAWELDGRYEITKVLEGDPYELELRALTLGVQYHFNPKTRLLLNAQPRDFQAPGFGSGQGVNANLDGVGTRYSARLNLVF